MNTKEIKITVPEGYEIDKPDNVWFILEDRDSMVAKWRELGFTCLQVNDGKF